jgi:hypothetical protein
VAQEHIEILADRSGKKVALPFERFEAAGPEDSPKLRAVSF